jgi:UDPglucose 6-dehydrogenase
MDGFDTLRVAMIGTGYVGLATGTVLAYLGHHVTGVDKDRSKIDKLRVGKSPIREHGLDELLALSTERLVFTQHIDEAVPKSNVILIAVGTPSKSNGEADTQYVEAAAQEVAESLLPGRKYAIVVKSTVPIGSNRRVAYVVNRVLSGRGLADSTHAYIVSNPEFLREGMALNDTLYPDRIVIGARESEGVEFVRRLYRPILEQTFSPPSFLGRPSGYDLPPMITTDPTSAETIKYAANSFLSLKISFINEIAGLCEKVGADVSEISRGIGLDKRIGPHFLSAGMGWGGSCFPKDTAALLAIGKEYGYDMPIVTAARDVNNLQRLRMVEKLQETLKGVRGRVIGILGLAFKPGTDDIRESPALDLVRILVDRGAHVRAHDPAAISNARSALGEVEVEFVSNPYVTAKGAEALVLATDWPEYRTLGLERLARSMQTPILLDGRNIFDRDKAEAAGFHYMGVGR